MHKRIAITILLALTLLTAPPALPKPKKLDCKDSPRLVGKCFTVHGRLSWHNETSAKLWPVGTKHLLGVPEWYPHAYMPKGLLEMIGKGDDVYANFEVCPFTKKKAGVMQMVCIASASHIVAKKDGN